LASLAKNITLSLGLISATVRVESATTTAESFKSVCTGQDGATHDPIPVKAPRKCESCGELAYGAPVSKAREVGGGLVLVTDEEIAQAKAAHDEKFKGAVQLVAHQAGDVAGATAQGEKLYQLVPEGEHSRYALIARLVAEHPELAFVSMYTVRSRAAMYVLRSRNGVLLLEERVTQDRLKPLPQVETTVNEAMLGMAETLLPDLITEFNVADYTDKYLAAIEALVAGRDAVSSALATVTPIRQTDDDLMAKLAAAVQEKEPAKPKRATRKAS
jgi:non-homologous end joining protein Ku